MFVGSLQIQISEIVLRAVAIEIKYKGYVTKHSGYDEKVTKLEMKKLNLSKILNNANVSFECKKRIEKILPINFGQLRRIHGLRPSSIVAIMQELQS
jgi:tRNA U34 5-carboxymethylaminomethyl modifying enzyme MnmG/GidA